MSEFVYLIGGIEKNSLLFRELSKCEETDKRNDALNGVKQTI